MICVLIAAARGALEDTQKMITHTQSSLACFSARPLRVNMTKPRIRILHMICLSFYQSIFKHVRVQTYYNRKTRSSLKQTCLANAE